MGKGSTQVLIVQRKEVTAHFTAQSLHWSGAACPIEGGLDAAARSCLGSLDQCDTCLIHVQCPKCSLALKTTSNSRLHMHSKVQGEDPDDQQRAKLLKLECVPII